MVSRRLARSLVGSSSTASAIRTWRCRAVSTSAIRRASVRASSRPRRAHAVIQHAPATVARARIPRRWGALERARGVTDLRRGLALHEAARPGGEQAVPAELVELGQNRDHGVIGGLHGEIVKVRTGRMGQRRRPPPHVEPGLAQQQRVQASDRLRVAGCAGAARQARRVTLGLVAARRSRHRLIAASVRAVTGASAAGGDPHRGQARRPVERVRWTGVDRGVAGPGWMLVGADGAAISPVLLRSLDQATPGRFAASDPRLTLAPGRAHGDFCPYRGHRLRIPHGAVLRAAWRGSLDGRTCAPPPGLARSRQQAWWVWRIAAERVGSIAVVAVVPEPSGARAWLVSISLVRQ